VGIAVFGRNGTPGASVEGGRTVGGGSTVFGWFGGRMMKQVGPALRWLACGAVGLRVVFV
jgi:hypothetical protein